jgi:hypothetical protein
MKGCCTVCPFGSYKAPFGEPQTYIQHLKMAPGGGQNDQKDPNNKRSYSAASDPTICPGCRAK